MKTTLWLATIIGLLPVVLFSLAHLAMWWASPGVASILEEQNERPNEDETSFVITETSVQFDGMSHPLIVNPKAWPAALALVGAMLCVIGLWSLLPRQPVYADSNGHERFERLLARVYKSSAEFPSLGASTTDGQRAIGITRTDTDEWQIGIPMDKGESETLDALRSYFESKGVAPDREYESRDEQFNITTVHLDYPLTGDASIDAEVCTAVFRDIFGVDDNEPMRFDIED
ncbi:MAG: hypothetical protein AAGJ46_20565 [Planctomycetota bacterium]